MDDPVAREVHVLLSSLDYPMLVVTTAVGEELSGCLVGFHTQCSIHPTRFLVCISRTNHTFGVAQRADHLGLHFLDEADMELARLFGERTGDVVDKFSRCHWHAGRGGVPVIDDCDNWVVVRILDHIDGGDHVGFVTEPVDAHATEGLRQLSYQEVRRLDPGHRP
jgi:flavin reductase (DIM6/NTAB) family NADH-FMN oxidoreductase RutF